MLELAADLPDARVRLAPVLERLAHLLVEDRPDPVVEVVDRPGVQVDRVQQGTPHVVLLLGVRRVADPHRSGVGVPRQVVEGFLGQVTLAPDAVHDLQVVVTLGEVGDEREEVDRLPVEAQGVHPPQRERRVADPAESVVVVAVAARRLGQRRRAGCHHGTGRGVGQTREGEGAALEVAAPGVVRELAARQPVLPVMCGPHQLLVRLLVRRGSRAPAPRQRHEPGVALLEHGARTGLATFEPEEHVGGQGQRDARVRRRGPALVVAVAGVLPLDRGSAVVEDRLAVHDRLHLARDAADRSEQDVLGLVVGRRPPVGHRTVGAVMPGPDQQDVPDDHPATRRAPAGLEDHRPREVAASCRDQGIERRQLERPGAAAEDRPEGAGCVEARNAHPVDRAARSHEGRHLTVTEEPVVPDRHGSRLRDRVDETRCFPVLHHLRSMAGCRWAHNTWAREGWRSGRRIGRPSAYVWTCCFQSGGTRPAGPGCRLVDRVGRRCGQLGPSYDRCGLVVEEPVLAGLEALDVAVPGGLGVSRRVLPGRAVTAPHLAAPGTTTQVHPPAGWIGDVAVRAAVAAGWHREIDR